MTNTYLNSVIQADSFTQVYHFTVNKLFPNETIPTNAPLVLLQLLAGQHTSYMVCTLELWLFCEARKICLRIEDIELQRKAIQENIVQRFIFQLGLELQPKKMIQVQELTQAILQKMGFQRH